LNNKPTSIMRMASTVNMLRLFVCLGILLVLYHDASSSFLANAKEIEVTDEWQKVEGNDTIPAGVHVRMDMTTGGKWVKAMSEDDEEEEANKVKEVNIGKGKSVAVVEGNGDVSIEEESDEPFQSSKPNCRSSLPRKSSPWVDSPRFRKKTNRRGLPLRSTC